MKRPRSIADLATVALACCAIVLTALATYRTMSASSLKSTSGRRLAEVPGLFTVGHVLGPNDAPIRIAVFSDFECPFCARAQSTMDSVAALFPEQVSFVYRHLPLETLHPHAWTAALASECAGEQGMFEAYHDALFEIQDSIGRIDWSSIAGRVRIPDVTAFTSCLETEAHSGKVERDVLLARTLHLRGTPTFVIGRELWEGVPPIAWFERHVNASLRVRAVGGT